MADPRKAGPTLCYRKGGHLSAGASVRHLVDYFKPEKCSDTIREKCLLPYKRKKPWCTRLLDY